MQEWVRVLKPGGLLKVAVPNLEWIASTFLSGHDEPTQGYIMGGNADDNDHHGAVFEEDCLTSLMEDCGLVGIRQWESEVKDCASHPVSLNLMGWKGHVPEGAETEFDQPAPREPETEPPPPITVPAGTIQGIMTWPRFGPTDAFMSVLQIPQLGIDIETQGGPFWHQGLQKLMEKHSERENGPKYLLTIDFDTAFGPSDVIELTRIMEEQPEIDAVCPIQMKRGDNNPLFMLMETPEEDGSQTVHIPREELETQRSRPIRTGHFGLTLIRCESLRRMPKPWLHAVHDADGSWGPSKLDADIYFWHKWRELGNTLHLALRVVVGHLELSAVWPDHRLRKIWQPVHEWNNYGKPPGVWR